MADGFPPPVDGGSDPLLFLLSYIFPSSRLASGWLFCSPRGLFSTPLLVIRGGVVYLPGHFDWIVYRPLTYITLYLPSLPASTFVTVCFPLLSSPAGCLVMQVSFIISLLSSLLAAPHCFTSRRAAEDGCLTSVRNPAGIYLLGWADNSLPVLSNSHGCSDSQRAVGRVGRLTFGVCCFDILYHFYMLWIAKI